MLKHFRVYWQTCVLLLLASAASATTIVLPTDDQLIRKSPVIVEGTVISSMPVLRGEGIWTETRLAVDRTIKGDAAGELTIREVGGEIGGRITKIFGTPVYTPGERVMVFLTPTPRGDYQTIDLFVGKFSEQRAANGRRLFVRDDTAGDVALLDSSLRPIEAKNVQRDATAFESYVTDRVAGSESATGYGVANPVLERDLAAATSSAGGLVIKPEFTLISEGTVYRWSAFDGGGSAAWFSFGTQPGYNGGGVNEIQQAMNAWDSYTAAKIKYVYAGAGNGTPGGLSTPNGINEVLFNDPKGEIAGTFNPSTGGVVGQGGFNGVSGTVNWTGPFDADGTHLAQTYHAFVITEGNLVIQDGVTPQAGISSTTLAEIVAHEFGHTLGFGHSADSSALMYASVSGGGPVLRTDDQLAARWLYPNGSSTPPPPTVPAAPTSLAATASGSTVNLSWTDNANNETGYRAYLASGSGAFSQLTPDLAAGSHAASVSSLPAGSYRFYVVAFNAAGLSSPSNTANVTVSASSSGIAADFSYTPLNPTTQQNISFSDHSSGNIATWLWTFGDGTSSNAQNPVKRFTSAGNYPVTLTVSTAAGLTSIASHTITVTTATPGTQPVSAAFDMTPASPSVHANVAFTDRSTGAPASWQWSFGDGSTSSAQNPVHAYATQGSYTVSLIVTNAVSSSITSHVITIAASSSYRSLVPAAAQTNGISGSVWRTELTLFNGGSEPAGGQFTFIPGGGGQVLTRSLYLNANQSITYANALSDLFGLSTGSGAITIEATSATTTPALRITSRTFTTGAAGTYGQSVPNVSDGDASSTTLLLTGLEQDANFRTNIGLVNRSAAPVGAGLTLYDADGNVIATTGVTVPANNFQQAPLASFFPAVNGGAYAALSMRVDAGAPNAISAYASVIDNRTQDPVYIQAIPTPQGSELTIPAVGRAPGAGGTFWRSDVTFFNPGLTTMTLSLRYLTAGQDNRNVVAQSVTIPPSRTVVLSDVTQYFGISSGSGALRVSWSGDSGPIATSRTYTTGDGGGTYGQSIDPVTSFGNDSYVPGLRSDSSFRSNVGFVNGGDSIMAVAVTLLSDNGGVIGTTEIALNPRSEIQYAIGALFPAANTPHAGTLTLLAHTDGSPNLFAYGSIIDNESGDPVFFGGR
ncbi:MAG TPA: PKD domain-containing protein [Thermoanaerobaculia bacterium]|jgi:PKD repeat protein|nr:PKD domain-containing protein [Thermoanaerobaculia bacterium]